ncbi:YhjD/YihY/BrkB family envelope integrity protein [Aridibaculum aurantiacum]|uniref:YhjD/YihY/BrkB family envelope integrity protein n=1 Tax=Aridibaculum aurantiacum TaxID=2810307 RepID=UPI001A9683B9
MKRIEKILLKSKPVAFIAHKSKQLVLPGFQGVPLYDVGLFFWKQINKVGLNERASAISFNFIMAIPAACIALFTLIPYLPLSATITSEILRLTRDLTPNQSTYIFVNNFLEDFLNTPRTGLLSFGFILMIFYSSNAVLGIINTFDKSIFYHKQELGFIRERWKAMKLTVILMGMVVGMVLLLIGQGIVFEKIVQWLNLSGSQILLVLVLRWLITLSLFFYGIAFIYKYAPSVTKRWRTFSPGAILATFLTIVTTTAFSFWVNNFGNYNKVYGSIGTVMILMLLIYLNSLILLIGFELNVSITYLKAEAEERKQKELSGLIEKEVLPKLTKQN